ncbi:MAG: hypothetical protein JRN35_05790 [Nitrososphaerota archaeon]|nr:hypothetical protein [Nitrososphaerota archaeon]
MTGLFNPANFADDPETIEGLLSRREKPPELSHADMGLLDLHFSDGVASVGEALESVHLNGMEFRALSRCACRVAGYAMTHDPVVTELVQKWEQYRGVVKRFSEPIRKCYRGLVEGVIDSYQPYNGDDYHVWFWDFANKQQVATLLHGIGIRRRRSVFSIFLAGSLAVLPGLDKIEDDLRQEYDLGYIRLRQALAAVRQAVEDLSGKLGEVLP